MPLTPPPLNRQSPTAVTPTPGSSSFHYSGAPLTSLKPFSAGPAPAGSMAYNARGGTTLSSNRKPHPLAQVSMMESAGTSLSDEEDLGLSRTVDLDHLRGSHKARGGMVKVSLAETEDEDEGRSLDERLAELDDTDPYGYGRRPSDLDDDIRQEYDSAFSEQEDGDSLRMPLSSPGVGRTAGARLSDAPLGQHDDLSFGPQGHDFSRDLSALDIPISPDAALRRRRPTAPTPNHASRRADENFPNISSTPASGFDGMARELRKQFEHITGLPSPSRSNADRQQHRRKQPFGPSSPVRTRQESNGTLRGLPIPASNDRARRVFGTELGNVNNANPAPAPAQKAKKPATTTSLNRAIERSAAVLKDTKKPTVKPLAPPRVTVEDDDDYPTPRPAARHFTAAAPAVPASNTLLLPPSAKRVVGGADASVHVPDVTGLTEGLMSPEKANVAAAGKEGGRRSRSGRVSTEPDPALTDALHQLRARLDSLEADNERSDEHVRALQHRLRHDRHADAERSASFEQNQHDKQTLEALVQSLRGHVNRLSSSLSSHSNAITSLRAFQTAAQSLWDDVGTVKGDVRAWKEDVDALRMGMEGLGDEVAEVRDLIEGLLHSKGEHVRPASRMTATRKHHARVETDVETDIDGGDEREAGRKRRSAGVPPASVFHGPTKRSKSRSQKAQGVERWRGSLKSDSEASVKSFIEPDELDRIRSDIADEEARRAHRPRADRHHSEGHAAATGNRHHLGREGARSAPAGGPAPKRRTISDELKRAEEILTSVPRGGHDDLKCSECRKRKKRASAAVHLSSGVHHGEHNGAAAGMSRKEKRSEEQRQGVPPQTVLARVLGELEADFEHHRAIFIELSDSYRKMDPATSHVGRRRILGEHLKESVDTLEQKADHIKRLYDLLHFRNVPADDSVWEAVREAGVCL